MCFSHRHSRSGTFQELAQELNMGYKGVAAIYYRAVQKLRREIRGDDK